MAPPRALADTLDPSPVGGPDPLEAVHCRAPRRRRAVDGGCAGSEIG